MSKPTLSDDELDAIIQQHKDHVRTFYEENCERFDAYYDLCRHEMRVYSDNRLAEYRNVLRYRSSHARCSVYKGLPASQ